MTNLKYFSQGNQKNLIEINQISSVWHLYEAQKSQSPVLQHISYKKDA